MPQLPGISLFDQVPWRPRPNLQQTLEYPWEELGRNLVSVYKNRRSSCYSVTNLCVVRVKMLAPRQQFAFTHRKLSDVK